MAHVTADRVRDTSTTTGTGSITVSGTAPTAFRTFSAVCSTNDTFYYAIQHQTAAEWEVGLGTYSSANTIARTTVYASSASGSAVSFSAGTKDVFITLAATRTVQLNNDGAIEGITDAGNLTFTGTGRRITGDFINGTISNRVMFQNSVAGNTSVGVIPNGTNANGNFSAYNQSDPNNASRAQLAANGTTDVRLSSDIIGTGTYLPMTFYTGGSERMRIDTSGNVGIATSSAAFATGYTGVQINSSTKTELRLTNSTIGTAATDGFAFYVNTVGDAYVWNNENATLQFATNNTERMRLTADGNLQFSGTGQRITGDFSTGTFTNRVSFQSSTTNGVTGVQAIPNGTSQTSTFDVYNASDPTNASFGQLQVNATDVRIVSNLRGTGTYLPMTFYTGGSERMRVDTSGNVGIGTSSPVGRFASVGGAIQLSGGTTAQEGIRIQRASGYAGIYGINNDNNAYNALAFFTSSTEAMRIDTSGNVGIGTSSPNNKLDVFGGNLAITRTSGTPVLNVSSAQASGYAPTQLQLYRAGSGGNTATPDNSVIGEIRFDGLSTGVAYDNMAMIQVIGGTNASGGMPAHMSFLTASSGANATERMRIDSSGNVGIGSTAPESFGGGHKTLELAGSTNTEGGVFKTATSGSSGSGSTGTEMLAFTDSTGGKINVVSSHPLIMYTANTERMRIKADGEVLIAGTTDQGAYNLQVAGTGVWGAGAYVNGSDARIKEDVSPITSGLDVVEKLNPVQFRYKEDWSKDRSLQPGFIAQELQKALAGKDYIDGVVQQGPEYLSVSYQTLIPVLVKAIQELKAELDTLKGAK